ncbi:acetate/propionate family kinase [Larsenimonas salina]|uniref:acetate/propionate family kinase n=1 Tax=Larsenimonas salina TaxID=1295565 RepID=UPI002073AC2E|nr:acetate/propionate family kinase [Larsenimonas salina]MCM5703827.1 acetate/propionate family kinase [Larsenimonas salina]
MIADSLILTLNAGSSSLKVAGFDAEDPELGLCIKGAFTGIGSAHPRLVITDRDGTPLLDALPPVAQSQNPEDAQTLLARELTPLIRGHIHAVGHRVVHGGDAFNQPTVVTDAVIERLARLTPLAPLHQGANLAPMRSIARRRPELLQVACFDTAFHHGQSAQVRRLPIPAWLDDEGVHRYGFHGLSYDYIARTLKTRAPALASGRVVVAHLGAGASLCALQNGQSVDTTMGFTALDGLPMGTRPGRLDAGIVLYLMREKRMSPEAIEHLLYHDCGLKALSGGHAEVSELESLAATDEHARAALAHFAWRIAQGVAEMATTLGGLDGLVFTAGIGEHSAYVRKAVVAHLEWLGLALDDTPNAAHAECIHQRTSRAEIRVMATDEAWMIARHTRTLLTSHNYA